MLDIYFKKPLFWDYLFAIIITCGCKFLISTKYILIPKIDLLNPIISDLSTIGLTLAGFILTLLTVLVSFKSSTKNKNIEDTPSENESTYELFYSTELYFATVKHLKNSIISLVFIAILGYLLKLGLSPTKIVFLFLFCILGIIIITTTISRCLLILSSIIKLQREN